MKKTIRTRQRGSKWYYSFDAGIIDGKRRQVSKGGFDTEKEAWEAGQEAYMSWKHGNIGIVSERIRIEQYLQTWLENVIKPEAKRSTYASYACIIKTRINPHLGSKYIQELRPLDIDRWMASLAKQNFSKGSIKVARAILSQALSYAIYPAELISTNPAHAVKVPKSTSCKREVHRVVISPEKLQEVLAKYPAGHMYHIPILLAYHTGMRAGEFLGLEWQDVDLERKAIRVRQQLRKDTLHLNFYFETPKTSTSSREFYIDSELAAELKRWKATQAAARMKLGEAYQIVYEDKEHAAFSQPCSEPCPKGAVRKDLVCTDRLGLFVKYPSLARALNLLGLNAHSFRHTHTTELAAAGAVPTDIAARLGHSDATMVNTVYAHDTDAMKRATAKIFEERIVHGE